MAVRYFHVKNEFYDQQKTIYHEEHEIHEEKIQF